MTGITDWLGRLDSNQGMAESKSSGFANPPNEYSENDPKTSPSEINRLAADSECQPDRGHVMTSPPPQGDGRVAALYVAERGCYRDLAGVDPWDQNRDARLYAGPYPVVAHPPCQRWGKMWFGQPLTVKRTGVRKIKGDDGGCFKAALAAVRKFGGVIEHPEKSYAWDHFGINKPPREGGWVSADFHGGWTCCVEQGRYGHYARKPTWLLVYGVRDLPEMLWGESEARLDPAVVARMGLKRAKRLGEVGARGGGTDSAARIGTPAPFRDLLLSIARSATRLSPALPSRAGGQ